jgi:NADH-quinone oxidoreductase subunit H
MTNAELISQDPGWLIVVKALLVFIICVVSTLLAVWTERRVLAKMQLRTGPNRVGPFGLIQSLADGVKLALKEDIIPAAADKVVFIAAPIIAASMCFMSFAVIPMTGKLISLGKRQRCN